MVALPDSLPLVEQSRLPWMHLRRSTPGNRAVFVTMIGHSCRISDRIRTCLLPSCCANYISTSWHRNVSSRKDVLCEARNSSQLPSRDRAMRLRQYVRYAFDDAGD